MDAWLITTRRFKMYMYAYKFSKIPSLCSELADFREQGGGHSNTCSYMEYRNQHHINVYVHLPIIFRAGTVQDFHGSVRFRFSYPRFDFFRIGSVKIFNAIK